MISVTLVASFSSDFSPPESHAYAYISNISFYGIFLKVNHLILCNISRSVKFPFLVMFSHPV